MKKPKNKPAARKPLNATPVPLPMEDMRTAQGFPLKVFCLDVDIGGDNFGTYVSAHQNLEYTGDSIASDIGRDPDAVHTVGIYRLVGVAKVKAVAKPEFVECTLLEHLK